MKKQMREKIKVLHIQETIGSGGVERLRLSLAKHLGKAKFEQKFICTFTDGTIPGEIRAEGYEVIAIGQFKSPFHWSQHKKIQKIIDDYQPDIIHGAVFEGVTMAAINGWIKKVPIVIIEETSDPQNRTWRGNFLMKFFSILADSVVGVSPSVVNEYLLKKININSEKVTLVNNGVALPRNVTDIEIKTLKDRFGIKDKDFVVGSIGRMLQDEHKKFSDLIKGFAKFNRGKDNCKLLLVGDGPEIKNYKRLVIELDIAEKVIFVGYQSDVTLYYKLMNIFSLVSQYEAFGLVLAEAMLNKLPVVATQVGGMKDIVDANMTGLLVSVGNTDQISMAFQKLYSDGDLLGKYGLNGYNKAMIQYTEEGYIQKIDNLYTELVNRKKNI